LKCSFCPCSHRAGSKSGLCRAHYQQRLRGRQLSVLWRRPWTAQEKAILREHAFIKTANELATMLNRSRKAIEQQRSLLGLVRRPWFRWDARSRTIVRDMNARGFADTDIGERLGVNRKTVNAERRRLGLQHQGHGPQARKKICQSTRQQLASLGLQSMAQLRLASWAARALERGWPTEINGRPINFRHIQILDVLHDKGPHTRQRLAAAIGMPWKGSRKSLVSNGKGGSYLAELMRAGLVVSLGKCAKGRGRGKSANLYSLTITTERRHG